MLPLEGIKILDLSRLAPGPFCSMMLGDLGADVLLVEAPADGKLAPAIVGARRGMPRSCAAYNIMSRNKRSIVLNLREQEAREIFYKLAETADVVLEGFRPGVVKRLGVDYDTLEERRIRGSCTARSPASGRQARTASSSGTTSTTSRSAARSAWSAGPTRRRRSR